MSPATTAQPLTLTMHLDECSQIYELLEMMEEADEDTRTETALQLRAALTATREKIDRTNGLLSEMAAAELAAALEMQRLAERKDRIERQRRMLESYVLAALDARGITRIEGFTSSLCSRKNPPAVHITDIQALPEAFIRETRSYEPAKSAIKAAIQDGQKVPGAELRAASRLERK